MVTARNRQDAKLDLLQVIVWRLMNISAHGMDMPPLFMDGMETLVWGLQEDAKESANVAAEVKVAADETKAASERSHLRNITTGNTGGPGGR